MCDNDEHHLAPPIIQQLHKCTLSIIGNWICHTMTCMNTEFGQFDHIVTFKSSSHVLMPAAEDKIEVKRSYCECKKIYIHFKSYKTNAVHWSVASVLVLILLGPLQFPYTCPCFPLPCTALLPLPHIQQLRPRIILFLPYLQFKACWLNYLRTVREKGNNCRQPSVSQRETLLRQLLG